MAILFIDKSLILLKDMKAKKLSNLIEIQILVTLTNWLIMHFVAM